METRLNDVFAQRGKHLVRAHPVGQHGFIDSQRMGMDVFAAMDPDAPVVVAEAVWQFSHHVLAGLRSHRGPILTVANWSGAAPGLVGLLNLNGSLTKMGVTYSTLWSKNFDDEFFLSKLDEWLATGAVQHDSSHVRGFVGAGADEEALGQALAAEVRRNKAIFGIFDEGCMGMFNAILDDHMLNAAGIYKERLSQAALVAEMQTVSEAEAREVYDWLKRRGMKFSFGTDGAEQLVEEHTLDQCRMYIAAMRIADRFSCDAIGIQYQLGLADMTASSDLAEGLFNNPDRPPVFDAAGRELYAGEALPHFNEVDEGAGLDAFVTHRVWRAMGMDPSTTLHDVRYGEEYDGEFVWVFLISGAAPASHFEGGYAGASSDRQPPMYFRKGGGSLKGVSRAGAIHWSRVYVQDGGLHCDMGLGMARQLPPEETERRWHMTTPAWPIMHGVLTGVSRDQLMGRHKSNHLNVVYATDSESAQRGMEAKAVMLRELGVKVHFCGV